MKTLICLLLLIAGCLRVVGQVQELEQLKLNLEKLAQLKLSLSEMKRGYQVLQNGYNSVRDVSRGNFDLHKNYLDEMQQVSMTVTHSPALVKLLTTQSRLLQAYKTSWQRIVSSNLFTLKELAEIRASYLFVMEEVAADMQVLDRVLAPGVLRMSDAERLAVVEKVGGSVEENLRAVLAMNQANDQLMTLRGQQKRDLDAVRRLNGLK